MGTREVLNKLNEKQTHTLETYSAVLNNNKAKGNTFFTDEYKNKIRGYLDCLRDEGAITLFEQRCLFGWFSNDHRQNRSHDERA